MKTKPTLIKVVPLLLALGISLSGCLAGSGKEMRDDSMNVPMETMEKGTMHEDTMHETMPGPMMDDMEKGGMKNDMSDSMK